MTNFAGLLRAPANSWEVILTRKPTSNDSQNIRRRREVVQANDGDEAKRLALALPHNAAFRVSSVRKI